MKKQKKRKAIEQFMRAAISYIQSQGGPAAIEGENVLCAVIIGENGYDVSLWCKPETSRFHCRCVIRNVFSEVERPAVVRLLTLLTQSRGTVGGTLGISATAGDLTWTTYCEAPGAPIGAPLIDEVIKVGVGKFDEMVKQVRAVVAGRLEWPHSDEDDADNADNGMRWN